MFKIEVSNGTKCPIIRVLSSKDYRSALNEARCLYPPSEYKWRLIQGGNVLAREGTDSAWRLRVPYTSFSFGAKPCR